MISLSNLFKQCFVINNESEKRIIDSDQRFKSGIVAEKVVVQQESFAESVSGSEELLDGFLAGLEAEEVIPEPQITPEEILEQAKAEADMIVATAKAEAMRIADDAKKEADMLFEQRKQEGYREGVAKMQNELDSQKARLNSDFAQMEHTLQSEYENRLETMESDIVDAVITVFNKVFDIQFDDKKQILLYLINNTLMNVEVGKEFHIRVSAANYKFIESRIGDIKEKIGNDVNIEIVNDMSLGAEDCVIETESGVFNCGIDMELANLEKDIRSLCS